MTQQQHMNMAEERVYLYISTVHSKYDFRALRQNRRGEPTSDLILT